MRFGLPVAALIDARAMAQTFGAVARGLADYRPALAFAGVVANRVASPGHGDMLRESVPADIPWLGGLPRTDGIELPQRHLGLHQPDAIADLEDRLDAAADLIADTPLAQLPRVVAFRPGHTAPVESLLRGHRIAVARDEAFSFVYPANLDLLRAMGADLRFFSPLRDAVLPEADSLYLPGGYPELHLDTLADNASMLEAVRAHHAAERPLVAECGGMLYLLEALTDSDGRQRALAGLIPARAAMGARLGGIGSQGAALPGGELRGHTFHYSSFEAAPDFDVTAVRHPRGSAGEGVICRDGLTASYVHWYLPSNPRAAARLFRGDAT